MSDIASLTSLPQTPAPALAGPGSRNADILGKEDFLKILVTQLTHQDPTQPMEDREFIGQMAQFSALEQMTNLNSEMARMAGMLAKGQALGMLGQMVQVQDGDSVTSGRVTEIAGNETPQLLVDGRYFDLTQVLRVIQEQEG